MAKFKVNSNLTHNNTEFPPGSTLDMEPSSETALHLVEIGVISRIKEEIPDAPVTKPVETFSAPSSTAEIQKAVDKAALAPVRRSRCVKCKKDVEIVDAAVTEKGGRIFVVGKCIICGTGMSRIQGRVKK